MLFATLIFLAAFSLEAVGTYVSVIGLADSFASNPIILTLAVILDVCKLLVVSLVYKKWDTMPIKMKLYYIPALIVMMVITSYGAMGYLQQSFHTALAPGAEKQIVLDGYVAEKAKHEARLLQINQHLDSIGKNYITKRMEERKMLTPEIERLQARVFVLDGEIPKIKQEIVQVELHAGPISAIAKSTGLSKEQASNLIIFMIIFVFDPLAVMLIIGGNFLLKEREEELLPEPDDDGPDDSGPDLSMYREEIGSPIMEHDDNLEEELTEVLARHDDYAYEYFDNEDDLEEFYHEEKMDVEVEEELEQEQEEQKPSVSLKENLVIVDLEQFHINEDASDSEKIKIVKEVVKQLDEKAPPKYTPSHLDTVSDQSDVIETTNRVPDHHRSYLKPNKT